MNMSSTCSTCGKTEEGMKKCSGCKAARYCSQSCQRRDWPVHKLVCKRVQKDAGSSTPATYGNTKTTVTAETAEAEDNRELSFITDNLTGTMRILPPGQAFWRDPEKMPKAPLPGPAELSRLVTALSSPAEHHKFFPQISGRVFTFITDLKRVQPEWAVGTSSIVSLDNTILIAKIIGMDANVQRHGICIVGEGNDKPVIVHFYVKGDNPFPFFTWSGVRPGNYISIQAPAFHAFMDGQIGFRVNHAWQVRILDASGKIISG